MIHLTSDNTPVLSESLCCVSFAEQQQSRVFLTSIRGIVEGPPRHLVLVLPSEISMAERPHVVFVPVVPEAQLAVDAELDDRKTYQGVVTNMSPIGMLVEFPRHAAPNLSVGSPIRLGLRTHNRSVRMMASVVRRNENVYAFSFLDEGRDNGSSREELAGILRDTEVALLRSHACQLGDNHTIVNLADLFVLS